MNHQVSLCPIYCKCDILNEKKQDINQNQDTVYVNIPILYLQDSKLPSDHELMQTDTDVHVLIHL